jgi:hypothetical protein
MARYDQIWPFVTRYVLLWPGVAKYGQKNQIHGAFNPIFPTLKQWALGTHFL